MFRKLFSFSNSTLLVALTLSTIAAWYSIIGLTAIFAGAVIPIIIMGSALELAKVVTTVWLRKYWNKCRLFLKVYLVLAVILLAFLTSMGIFGFLSKAHTDQNLVSGDVVAKLNIYDEKIKTAKENIEADRKALKQLDEAVDQIMARSTSEEGAARATAIRKSQQRDRTALAKQIETNQKLIASLNEEASPIRAEVRKVEAEVGPIKYIAAMIYGDDPDANLLERAVRWVIIILVIVFDPLALMLVIAGNQSKEWDKEIREKEQDIDAMPLYVADVGERPTQEELKEINEWVEEPPKVVDTVHNDPHPVGWMFTDPGEHPKDNLQYKDVAQEEQPVAEAELSTQQPETPPVDTGIDIVDRPGDYLTSKEFEGIKVDGEWVQTGPEFKSQPIVIETDGVTKEAYKNLPGQYVEYQGKRMRENVLRSMHPELLALREDSNSPINTNFGNAFPEYAVYGDVFVRTDALPNRVYKFNGNKWIEQKKETSDSYLSDEYVTYLVQKLATGEFDIETMTPAEQDAVENYLKKQ